MAEDTRFRARAMAHGPRLLDAVEHHLAHIETLAHRLKSDGDAATAQTLRDIADPLRDLHSTLANRETL